MQMQVFKSMMVKTKILIENERSRCDEFDEITIKNELLHDESNIFDTLAQGRLRSAWAKGML